MSAEKLYTPDLLAAAVELASYPAIQDAPLHGTARSITCGSAIEMDLVPDQAGKIDRIGMTVRACAVGQTAAAVFARHATGKERAEIQSLLSECTRWLEAEGTMPNWPDLALLERAREYRGRHGAILLPWRAALDALSSRSPSV